MSFSHGDWSCFNLQWRAVPPHTRWQFWRKRMTVSTSDLWEMRLLHWLVATLSSPFPRIGRNLACCLSADRFFASELTIIWEQVAAGNFHFSKEKEADATPGGLVFRQRSDKEKGFRLIQTFKLLGLWLWGLRFGGLTGKLVPPFPTDAS